MYIKNGELHIVWCVEDVKQQAKGRDITLTDEECINVLGVMLKRHDCEMGSSWDTMDNVINEVIEGRTYS